jgi:phosphoserine phosphatase
VGAASVLVLTSASGVTEADVRLVRRGLGELRVAAGDPVRLAESAVEMAVEGEWPAGIDPRALAGDAAVDVNRVPVEDRLKRVLVADMDSTIIGVECIDELADFAGVKDEVAVVTEAAMRGELDFEGALVARVKLLEGLPEAVLARAYEERVRLNPGARVLAETMGRLGAATALVSGGFTFFTERVAAAAGFAEHQANRLVVSGGRLTGEVERPILGRSAKRAALETVCRRLGLGPEAAVAVGDGANDLDMVRAAGLGVAYRAKPALADAADARLDHSDLTAILALQGIPADEWVVG